MHRHPCQGIPLISMPSEKVCARSHSFIFIYLWNYNNHNISPFPFLPPSSPVQPTQPSFRCRDLVIFIETETFILFFSFRFTVCVQACMQPLLTVELKAPLVPDLRPPLSLPLHIVSLPFRTMTWCWAFIVKHMGLVIMTFAPIYLFIYLCLMG